MNWDEMWKFVTNERHDGKKYLILQNMEGAWKISISLEIKVKFLGDFLILLLRRTLKRKWENVF